MGENKGARGRQKVMEWDVKRDDSEKTQPQHTFTAKGRKSKDYVSKV